MKSFFAASMALVLAGFVGAADLKSGPQVDEKVPGPFHPLNVNGENAGKKHCLFCENGQNPVAMVFAREITPEVTKLIKAIDAATTKNKGKMGSFVVFLNGKEGLEDELKALAKKSDLKSTVLSIDQPAGPKGYEVAKDADVTVILYNEVTVKANWAFKKGDLKEANIPTIISGLSKILPKD